MIATDVGTAILNWAGVLGAVKQPIGMIKHMFKQAFHHLIVLRNSLTRRWYTLAVRERASSAGEDLTVHGPSSVNANTVLGDNVNFQRLEVRGDGELTIGDNFHSGPGVCILTRNHNYNGDALPYDDTYIRDPVEIKENVWLGARVTVVPGVQIGEGAIVQAGSTVVNDVPQGAIVGGHPAEQFSERDMENYRRLKKQGAFH
jgi:acetyltransferase-like isoleucine patch superfamily enzyme